eukprot:1384019-Amorphochlora_amoeboformis.AAC.1
MQETIYVSLQTPQPEKGRPNRPKLGHIHPKAVLNMVIESLARYPKASNKYPISNTTSCPYPLPSLPSVIFTTIARRRHNPS